MKTFKFLFTAIFIITLIENTIAQNRGTFLNDSLTSVELNNKGIVSGRIGDFEKALDFFQKSYLLRKKIYGDRSPRLASPLINIGIQFKNLGDHKNAISNYKLAESIIKTNYGEQDSRLAFVYNNLGNIYKLAGDYNQALEYFNHALSTLKNETSEHQDILKTTKYNLAETYCNLRDYPRANAYINENLKSTLPRLRPRYYDLLAVNYKNLKDYKLSDYYFNKAIAEWSKLFGEENIELGFEYLGYSSMLLEAGLYDKGYHANQIAESVIGKYYGEKSRERSNILINYGDYYFLKDTKANWIDEFRARRKQNLAQALKYYQKAAVAVADSFETDDPYLDVPIDKSISDIQLLEALKKKALTLERLGDIYLSEFEYENAIYQFSSALGTLTDASKLIHQLRTGYISEDSKLFLAENQESTFMSAIGIACKLYEHTKDQKYINLAFEFSERSKSATLLASMKDIEAKEFGGIPEEMLDRERFLKINIANYKQMLFDENQHENPDTQKTNLYSNKIFQYNEEYSKLVQTFETNYPKYYSFKYANKVTDISEVRKNLSGREALIEYVVDKTSHNPEDWRVYRFYISKTDIGFSKIKINVSFDNDITFLHHFLTTPDYLSTRKADFIKYSLAANNVYNILLRPIAQQLKGKIVTIVPDEKLAYIPFDALLTSMPDTSRMDFRNLSYLIKDFTVNYTYSATLLYNYLGHKSTATKKLLAFAPVYKFGEIRSGKDSNQTYNLNPLPGAVEEVTQIHQFISGNVFEDKQAQESTFKKLAGNYDILHLSMHTIMNDSLPMFSKLVFAAPEDSQEDGFLNTQEIYNMKLQARLAVLSACNTGSGKLYKGEGVMSLARGFLYAGCPSIVMTLWQVEDKSGAEIMKSFYRYLSHGKRKDVALRLAKLDHIKNADPLKAHPHYWLGYVTIGNPDPMYNRTDIYIVIIIILVVGFILADQILRRKNTGKRF
jgi:CHAT domain-containing protein